MEENKDQQEIKTPITVMMDMAKNEIESHVFACIEKNHIPPALMVYVLNNILLDIYQVKIEQLSDDFVELQKKSQ